MSVRSRSKLVKYIAILTLVFMCNLAMAGTTHITSAVYVKNLSRYPILWGASVTNAYADIATNPNNAVLLPGQSSPRILINGTNVQDSKGQTDIGPFWRIMIASGINAKGFVFTSHVSKSKIGAITVTGSGQTLKSPADSNSASTPENDLNDVLLCGLSKASGPNALAPTSNTNYTITIYNINEMSSCPAE